MILAICQGGVTSNLISHVSKGDTALSITLTAISGVITAITIPFVLRFSLESFMAEGERVSLPMQKRFSKFLSSQLFPCWLECRLDFCQKVSQIGLKSQ